MPIHKIVATKRGKAAVAAALAVAMSGVWGAYTSTHPVITPAAIHQAIDQGITPPAVTLAVEKLIKPWEGFSSAAYRDSIGKPTVCYGETLLNGRPVRMGDFVSREDCEKILIKRVIHDYYLPLVDGVKDYVIAPDSVQASMLSGAYNYGPGAAKKSRTAGFVTSHRYRQACEAQTAFNKAGGHILPGLVVRREMGDAQRIGEAELCVSGLK